MDRNDIIGRISAAIADIVFKDGRRKRVEIRPDSNLIEDLDADSLHCIEVVLEIEELFDIEISDQEAEGAFTVNQLADIVAKKLEGRRG